ncbi:MAG: MFS transporter [Proteobacteria bacterium]|nr:MFS transporter [Pseudomonadota bacterium]
MGSDRRGILAVAGSSIAISCPGVLIFSFPGVMGPSWQDMFDVGKGAIGNTLFFLLAAVGIFMFFVGQWQEKFGIRRMITIGAIITGLTGITLAYAWSIYLVYLWAFLIGLGCSFIYIPALTTVQRWYPERRGLVSGIVNVMFALSAAIMSPVFAHMLRVMGYFVMNIVVAVFTLVIGGVAAQFTESPERLKRVEPESEIDEGSRRLSGASVTVRESIRTNSFWFLWVTWALQGAAGMSMVTLSVAFGLSIGLAIESAVVILTVFNIMNGLSRLLMGYLSDVVGRSSTMSIAFFAAGFAYFVLPQVEGLALTAVLVAIIGLAFGTLFAVSAPLAADCFGLEHFGAILGLVFTAYGFLSGALGPSLSGYLLDITEGNFTIVFTYLGVFCVLSGFLIRFVHPPQAD